MKAIYIRFTNGDALYDAIKESAKKNRRSLNAEILQAVELYLKNTDEAKPVEKEVVKKKSKSP